ncbi:Dabb family protein [Membranicola marinus]|uniref:Dabb family protein n=1 Tax=Membranihabitans marinus TaxID=1227546 RepID=A0A953LER8_9BACT|nr:Dabb family protein [Membranihabitans marinus]MBY5960284.1 Dabb family protein [Membranihabitans marinus]
MKNILIIGATLLLALSVMQCGAPQTSDNMITHTVYFKLKHPKGSEEEKAFIQKAVDLGAIETVHNLRSVKEVSPKNNFDFGLIMQFEDQAGYDFYNNHPDHVDFVENVWKKEVVDFMEIDYVPNE